MAILEAFRQSLASDANRYYLPKQAFCMSLERGSPSDGTAQNYPTKVSVSPLTVRQSDLYHAEVMHPKNILTALIALAASVSFAGPARLATSFFLPSGRTNPVILDAKADASGNLVTAAQADVVGGKQIVISKFSAAGVRRWSSTINTPVAVTSPGQVAGKFQIMLDGVGNTYVLSPRAGNPVVDGTTQDIIVRKLNDSGATVGYLSLVGYLFEQTLRKHNVLNAQMQSMPTGSEVVIACTGVHLDDGVSSAYAFLLRGGTSGSSITVDDRNEIAGSFVSVPRFIRTDNYSVAGLLPGRLTAEEGPQLRLFLKREFVEFNNLTLGSQSYTTYLAYETAITPSSFDLAGGSFSAIADVLGFEAEGVASTNDQGVLLSKDTSGARYISRGSDSLDHSYVPFPSALAHTATRVGDNWLVYGQSTTGEGEFFLQYPSVGDLTATSFTISDAAGAPYYAGNSLTSSRGRAYLAGGPTVGSVQGMYSSFSDTGELLYTAGQTQPFTLSTSFVVPAANNRFWTVGRTSTGLQAVILWREPDYFVGISSPKLVSPGDTVTMKAHLNTPAPSGGYTFAVSVSSNLQDAPRTVTVPAGASSATFTVKVKNPVALGPATVVARTNATHDINTAHTAPFSSR